jgi:uridine phosphorylase
VLYTPLAFESPSGDWLADALGVPSRPLGPVAVQSRAYALDLPEGPITTLIGPLGAPATVSTLEAAVALGARRILFFGVCGSLHADLRIGDLVLVERALREEGTSYHYLPADAPAVPSPELLALARGALADEPHRAGVIWTTDAPYRETRTKVARLAADGVLGVEMETSAVYAMAAFRRIEAISLQIVSDQLVGEKWTGITRETFRERCDHAVRVMARFALSSPLPVGGG